MKKVFITIISIMVLQSAFAQIMTAQQYIQQYKDLAIAEMQRSGVPAAITLAQGLLETENGNSVLAKIANNHFGIKCKENWTGGRFRHDDDLPGECFRVYKNAAASYKDHSDFLRSRPNYASLFDLDPTDYKGWAYGLKKAGYATNPKYPLILISNIEQYNLEQYTIYAMTHSPKTDSSTIDTVEVTKITTEKTTIEKVPNINPDTTTQKTITTIVKTIPAKTPVTDSTTSCTPEATLTIHEVQQGESLYSIAKKYNVTPQQIRDWNKFTGDDLKIGQQIIVTQ